MVEPGLRMDAQGSPRRLHPLAGFADAFAPKAIAGVTLSAASPANRYVLRGTEAVAPASAALSVAIPTTPMRAAGEPGGTAALWLGPDEWLLLLPETADTAPLETALAGSACSLVDVSHRQIGIVVEGEGAAATLNAAVPLDLDERAFPVGMCTRTIFEKTDIVLWRTDAQRFHIEVWGSFAPYVWELLEAVRHENQPG